VHSSRRLVGAGLAAALSIVPLVAPTALTASPALAAAPPTATGLSINEVNSDPEDWFELANPTENDIDLAGLWFVDSDTESPDHWVALTGTVPAGGVLAIDSDDVGFGKGDTLSIYAGDKAAFDANTAALIDSVTWPDGMHATSMGVCPERSDELVSMTPTKGATNDCPAPGIHEIRVNEVLSDSETLEDYVELTNIGTIPVDINGWTAVDGDPDHDPLVIATEETVIEPGEYFVFRPDDSAEYPTAAFGLGKGDSITIALPDGTEVDTTTWPEGEHAAPSWGRCPDGRGDFAFTLSETPGAANDCPEVPGADQITINEVHSDADPDWIELMNTGENAVDLTGWLLSDDAKTSDPTHLQEITASTSIAAGEHLVIEYTAAGLGKGDEVYLYLPDAITLVDSTSWPDDTHATSWGRCDDGAGEFRFMEPTPGQMNDCTELPDLPLDPNWDDIEINEISSLNDDDSGNPGIGDAIELVNTGEVAVTIEGWYQTDSGSAAGASRIRLADLMVWNGDALEPAGSWEIPAGGYVVFSSTSGLSGEGDAVKLYGPGSDAASRQLVDEQAYGDGDGGVSDNYASDSLAFAACPDGSDEFWRVTESSFGQNNDLACETKSRLLDTTVVLNEVSNVDGKAELLNVGNDPVDISGWQLLDSESVVVHTVPADTVIAAGAFYLAEGIEGLKSVDSLTIRAGENGSSIIGHTWYEDGIASYSRCEIFGAVSYVETPTATWGAANECPGIATEKWPGSSEVTTVDAIDAFTDLDSNDEGDVSGATFDPDDPSVLWVTMNKGRLFKMHLVDGQYETFPEWDGGVPVRFADGAGELDAEGVTVGPDGAIYLTSERDNARAKDTSYNKVARFDVTNVTEETAELVATHEWDLNSFVVTGTNLGLEGITYVPDTYLVASGWQIDGVDYTVDDYPTDGLFVTSVEGTGALHFFSLERGEQPVEVKVESSGFPWSMDVTFDPDRDALWALCDDGCGGVYNVLTVVEGDFEVLHSYSRPAGMPNLNNEGMAIAPASTCANGEVAVIWTDDGDTDGYSLRAGTLPCVGEDVPSPETETETGAGTTTDEAKLSNTGAATPWAAAALALMLLVGGAMVLRLRTPLNQLKK